MTISLRRSAPFFACLFLLSGMLPAVAAGDDTAGTASDGLPTRFLDDQTLVVVRFDLDRLDVDKATKWLTDSTNAGGGGAANAAAAIRGAGETAGGIARGLTKAGARRLFLVVSMDDQSGGRAPGFFVVPLSEGGGGAAGAKVDAEAVRNVFAPGSPAGARADAADAADAASGWKSETIDDAVVAGTAGTIERLRALQPVERPDIAKVLAGAANAAGAAGDAAIVAAVAPTDDLRKVFEQIVPNLPPELGSGPTTMVTRGVRWARVAVNLPPEGSVDITLQSQDAASAKSMAELVERGVKALAKNPRLREVAGNEAMERVAGAVRARVEQDRVSVVVDRAAMNDLARPLAGMMAKARQRAALTQSANNVRQLLIGCILFADANQGRLPDTLEQAAKSAAGDDDALAASLLRSPHGSGAYEYVKPKAALTALPNVADTLVVYEKADKWQGPAVLGFADGHVVVVNNEAEFRKRVEAARQNTK